MSFYVLTYRLPAEGFSGCAITAGGRHHHHVLHVHLGRVCLTRVVNLEKYNANFA